MEGLLATFGIDAVSLSKDESTAYHYVYSDRMIERNIFIEICEKEIEVGSPENYEYDTSVTVISLNDSALSFTLFFDERPLVAPLAIVGIVRDAKCIIEMDNLAVVFPILKQASIGVVTSGKDFVLYQVEDLENRIREKIDTIHQLIAEKNAQRN